LSVVFQRGSQRFEKQVTPNKVTVNQIGDSGWYPDEPIVVSSVEENMPAAKAGIRPGDRIVAMDGQRLDSIQLMISKLQDSKEKPVQFTVLRNEQSVDLTIQPMLAGRPNEKPKNGWFYSLLRR